MRTIATELVSGLCWGCNLPYEDSEIVMVDLAFGDDFFNEIGHGTTSGRPFLKFRAPTKILMGLDAGVIENSSS